jgi:hypothetical protein
MYLVYYKNTCLYLKENEPYILHISKLNRTFDCVLGTPSWMYKKKCEHFFLCISKLNRTFASDKQKPTLNYRAHYNLNAS